MKKKTLIQLLLLALIIIIIFYFYVNNIKDKDTVNNALISPSNTLTENSKEDAPNIIYNLKYVAKGKNDSEYLITSKIGELNEEAPELILMRDVVATINLKNSKPIQIFSDIALYNSMNFNTKFQENVLMKNDEHIITSDNLDLMFEDNIATILNNVVYTNLNTKMRADKIEIDLITKDSKIFMNNKSKKVKIESIY